MTLETLSNFAEIISASSIVTGLVFGLVQLRHYRTEQRNSIAQSLAQTFYDENLARAIARLQSVPDGIPLERLRELGPEYAAAAVTVISSFETMGILVFKRIAPFELVLDLAGGVIVSMNRKLCQFQEDLRVEQNQPSWGEWFTWLAEQAERVKDERPPAHIAHRDWRP